MVERRDKRFELQHFERPKNKRRLVADEPEGQAVLDANHAQKK
jgi:hypothetical protein